MIRTRLLFGAAALVLFTVAIRNESPREAGPAQSSITSRLLGPARSLAASLQWIRFDRARNDGRFELAYARAELALELDPTSAEGWRMLANHLAFDRGGPGQAMDAEARLSWFRAGLNVLRRGEDYVPEPSELIFLRALLLSAQAEYETDCVWPGGSRAAYRAAAVEFERAGYPEFAQVVLEAADRAPEDE